MNYRNTAVLLLACLPLSLNSALAAETEERAPTGEWSPTADGCQVWNVTPRPTRTINWTGECVAGKVNGKGTIDYGNGNRYKGSFKNGVESGNGTFYAANGDRFEGVFTDGKENGKGKIAFASGASYDGHFKDGKKDGQGRYLWTNGNQFEGQYEQDKRHGPGKFTWADGSRYVGEYRGDQRNGYGVFSWRDGSKYEGTFSNGMASGGKLSFANGQVLSSRQLSNGQWVNETYSLQASGANIENLSIIESQE